MVAPGSKMAQRGGGGGGGGGGVGSKINLTCGCQSSAAAAFRELLVENPLDNNLLVTVFCGGSSMLHVVMPLCTWSSAIWSSA